MLWVITKISWFFIFVVVVAGVIVGVWFQTANRKRTLFALWLGRLKQKDYKKDSKATKLSYYAKTYWNSAVFLSPTRHFVDDHELAASKNSKDDLTWKQLMQSIAPASGKRTAAVSSSTSSPAWASSSSMPFILFYCLLLNIYLLYLYDHLTHEYKTMWLSHCEKLFFSVWNFCIFFEHRLNACLEVLNVKMWQNARNFTQKRAPWTFSTTGHLCKQSIQQLHSVQLQCTSTSELQIATMVIFTSFFIQEKLLNTKKYFHDLYTIYQ